MGSRWSTYSPPDPGSSPNRGLVSSFLNGRYGAFMTGPWLRRFIFAGLIVGFVAIALLPWWHNRPYVRSFFDYGVIMGGTGRLEQGQRPYVDFVTPIQTGWFVLNWAAEKVGGDTFQAMTWSGAVSIVLTTAILGLMLARRWPGWAAALVAGSIACATVSQHTILWYNPWGVFLLAVVAWAGAVAPVWRYEQRGWSALMAGALFFGGINKINMQLMALGLVAGWALRAAMLRRATWRRAAGTFLLALVFGVVLPIAAEMAWTGASFSLWWHNVVAQMAGSRSGMLLSAMRWEFLFKPAHDYYDPLRLPQVGFVGVLLSLFTTAAIFRHAGGKHAILERVLGLVCGVVACLGGEVLLATNMDIAYIALGGWLALVVALWLGFALPARGPWFWSGIVVPASVIGAAAWDGAWRGQRSQFGYSRAPRSDYVSGERAGADFGYLQGTFVPPENFNALKAVGEWRAELPAERKRAILYGPGSEWAAHLWPAVHTPELPLYILGGLQFGPKEYAATYTAVSGDKYKEILVSLALDHWTPELARILQFKYTRRSLGDVFYHYSRPDGGGFANLPIPFIEAFGGNTRPAAIKSNGGVFELDSLRRFVGTSAGRETMRLDGLTTQLKGEFVVRRLDPAFTGPAEVEFAIFAETEGGQPLPRLTQRVELPAGKSEAISEYSIDSDGGPTRFAVEVPPQFADRIAAGWRGPTIQSAYTGGPGNPNWVHDRIIPVRGLSVDEINRFLPSDREWTPSGIIVSGGRFTEAGLELEPSGEIWIHVVGNIREFAGTVSIASDRPLNSPLAVRCLWTKDVQLELLSTLRLSQDHRTETFQAACAQPGGWLVLAADYVEGAPPVTVRVTRFKRVD